MLIVYSFLAGPARVLREKKSARNYQVQNFAGLVNDLAGCLSANGAADATDLQCRENGFSFVGGQCNIDSSAHFAVYLNTKGHKIIFAELRIEGWPSRTDDEAKASDFIPDFFSRVGRKGL